MLRLGALGRERRFAAALSQPWKRSTKPPTRIWRNLERADWLEAFSHHPQIGDKPASGSESHRQWAAGEQAGARAAAEDVKTRLARGNRAYFEKFGYIYIVCATGKTAEGMLAILESTPAE